MINVLVSHIMPILALGAEAALRDEPGIRVTREYMHARELSQLRAYDVLVTDYTQGISLSGLWTDERRARGSRLGLVLLSDRLLAWDIRHALERNVNGYVSIESEPGELALAVRSARIGRQYLSPGIAHAVATSFNQESLTLREREVLAELARGLSNKRISARLGVTEGTIKTHMRSLLVKLVATSRLEVIAKAREQGLIEQPQSGAPLTRRATLASRRG